MIRLIQLIGLLGFAAILTGQSVEQTAEGTRPAAAILAQFDGLGAGFEGPQGTGDAEESVRQFARRRSGSRRPNREFAHGDLHEAGPPDTTKRDASCTAR
jgi:hypothetical protein